MEPETLATETTQVEQNENRDSFISAVEDSDCDASSYSSAVEFQIRRNSHESCEEENAMKTKIDLTYSKIPWTLFSIIMYLVDVGSDWILGMRFAAEGQWLFFMLTFIFIFMSSLLVTLLSRQKMKRLRVKLSTTLICLFNLTPVPIYWHIICLVRRYLDSNLEKIRRVEYKMFLEETCNVNGLRLLEGYFEATPQFILQNTILFSQYPFEWSITMGFQLLSIFTSSLGFILTIFSWYRSSEFINERFISVFGGLLYAIGMAVPIVCRSLYISAAFSVYQWYFVLCLLVHVLGFSWWECRKLENIGGKKYLAIAFGMLSIIAPYFGEEKRSFKEKIAINGIMFLEDLVMAVAWGTTVSGHFIPAVLTVMVLDLVGRCIHPLHWKYRECFISNLFEDLNVSKKMRRIEEDL